MSLEKRSIEWKTRNQRNMRQQDGLASDTINNALCIICTMKQTPWQRLFVKNTTMFHTSAVTGEYWSHCLEVKREYYQNSSVLDCVTQCSQLAAHLYEHFLQVQQMGLSHWDPYTVRRGSCLELYYCNMVEWFWWDWSLISTTNWFPSVLWHCWFGHLASKNRPRNDL